MQIQELYKLFLVNPLICTDTRRITKGSIFFALKGENFNGNNFAQLAIEKGCAYAIVDEEKFCKDDKIILVANVLECLQKLAKHHRKQLSIPIIGVTGTNGKTTSKELIQAVLSTKKKCYATKGNLNNHIGVPLSILKINQNHEIAIIEMGANHIGEIASLCDISQPNYGVITNIGKAHLEGFGSIDGVIKAKTELYQYILKNKGNVFVSKEDDLLLNLSDGIERITYGNKGGFCGEIADTTPFVSINFDNQIIKSNLIGDYQSSNIMLAVCIGKHFEITDENIKLAIENYTPTNNRSEIIETKNNKLILDAYNANPSSMNSMLHSFAKQNYENKLCVLGDMLEMGETSLKEHQAIINLVNELKLESIFIGKEFSKINTTAYNRTDAFAKFLNENPIKNKTILLKGSRGIELEKLVELL
jgi:UDP-N-acetylmuramoyl-tripeptide--D-alanyl-D-alanine ligase